MNVDGNLFVNFLSDMRELPGSCQP